MTDAVGFVTRTEVCGSLVYIHCSRVQEITAVVPDKHAAL